MFECLTGFIKLLKKDNKIQTKILKEIVLYAKSNNLF